MSKEEEFGMRGCSTHWRALVVHDAIVMAVTAPGTAAQSAAQSTSRQDWTVTGNVVFDIMDYEYIGKNDRCRYNIPIVNSVRAGGPPANYWYFGKCAGEIRTEIHYQLQRASWGMLTVDQISVLFFEGKSAETNALKGVGAISKFLIWPDQTRAKKVRVQNDVDGQRDDRTIVTFTLHNP